MIGPSAGDAELNWPCLWMDLATGGVAGKLVWPRDQPCWAL